MVAYQSLFKARTQLNGKSLQELAAAVKQLTHWAPAELYENFSQREAPYVFADNVKDSEVQQHFLMGSERSLNEALTQVLMVEAVKVAARPLVKLQEPS